MTDTSSRTSLPSKSLGRHYPLTIHSTLPTIHSLFAPHYSLFSLFCYFLFTITIRSLILFSVSPLILYRDFQSWGRDHRGRPPQCYLLLLFAQYTLATRSVLYADYLVLTVGHCSLLGAHYTIHSLTLMCSLLGARYSVTQYWGAGRVLFTIILQIFSKFGTVVNVQVTSEYE